MLHLVANGAKTSCIHFFQMGLPPVYNSKVVKSSNYMDKQKYDVRKNEAY
jgi:hypothetical protein